MEWLLRLARSRFGGRVAGWLITYMSFLIPAQRLRETDTLLAFHHPRPAHALHILLLPKRPRRDFSELSAADGDFLTDLVAAVQSLVAEYDLAATGYRLITNGGEYQEVPHLHFHLVADRLPGDESPG